MDTRFFVIAIAIGTILLTTGLALYMQRQNTEPQNKRLLWLGLAAGVVLLAGLSILFLTT